MSVLYIFVVPFGYQGVNAMFFKGTFTFLRTYCIKSACMSKNTAKKCLLKKIFCSMKSVTSEIAVTVFPVSYTHLTLPTTPYV